MSASACTSGEAPLIKADAAVKAASRFAGSESDASALTYSAYA